MEDKKRIIQDSHEVIEILTDTTELDLEISNIGDEIIVISELVNKLVKQNSKTKISLKEYNKKYEELSKRYESKKSKQYELLRLRSEKRGQALKMKSFLVNLEETEDQLNYWNPNVWMLMVESATVHRDTSITFRFKDGNEMISQ